MKKIIPLILITILLSSCSFGKKDESINTANQKPIKTTNTGEVNTPVIDSDNDITPEEEDDIVNETMEEIEDIFNLLDTDNVQ